jgi:Putative DNA-binding domain
VLRTIAAFLNTEGGDLLIGVADDGAEGDFFVRSGPGTVRLPPESTKEYIRTRFPAVTPASKSHSDGAGAAGK